MTVNEALALAKIALDDTGGTRYKSTEILLPVFNAVQEEIANLVSAELLRSLHSDTTDTMTVVGATLPSDYLKPIAVELTALSPTIFCKRITVKRISDVSDLAMLRPSTTRPHYLIWSNSIYILMDTAAYSTDYKYYKLYYIKTPTALAAGSNFEIHNLLHLPLVDMALAKMQLTYKFGNLELAAKNYDAQVNMIMAISNSIEKGELNAY